jgi:hypothetical protein
MTTSYESNRQGQGKPNEKMKNDVKDAASQASGKAKQEAKNKIDQNRNTVSQELEKVAHATQAAASDLREQDRDGLSRYVGELAESMTSLATSIRSKNMDELIHDASSMAKKNPTLFIAGSIAIGLGVSRFAKSSSSRAQQEQLSSQGETRYTGDTGDTLYPGYSDMEPESRKETTLANSFSDDLGADQSATRSDYSDRDFPSTDTANPPLRSESGTLDTSKGNNLGGKRYE